MNDTGLSVIGFDVYGTLVDPLQLSVPLRQHVGDHADRFAELWRQKQIEYSFRRGLMRAYEDFDVCTQQALRYTLMALGIALGEEAQQQLLASYQRLELFPDVVPALRALKERGHRLVAFSNGVESSLRSLLTHAGAVEFLDDIVSVDDVRTFKPDPTVYHYLAERNGTRPEATWLVSSNAWDVIGAQSAGLRTAWVKRQAGTIFDPWGVEPELVVGSLAELAERLPAPG